MENGYIAPSKVATIAELRRLLGEAEKAMPIEELAHEMAGNIRLHGIEPCQREYGIAHSTERKEGNPVTLGFVERMYRDGDFLHSYSEIKYRAWGVALVLAMPDPLDGETEAQYCARTKELAGA